LALPPPTRPSLFETLDLSERLDAHYVVDIRSLPYVKGAVSEVKPEVIFHLAAQPLVRYSYANPVETYEVNAMGTVHLLEALRSTQLPCVIINVTTDKCYDNREWPWPYRESDPLGGHDPYSSSKACSELVTAAYRASFLENQGVKVATARAGNVIGGGDWATDRLVPDFLRAIDEGKELVIRSPQAVRPWQHVLEPLSGYLRLAEAMWREPLLQPAEWNFGPDFADAQSVEWIVKTVCERVPGSRYSVDETPQPHEANVLRLDSSRARVQLGWKPQWTLLDALERTLSWHKVWKTGGDVRSFTSTQISEYENAVTS